MSTLPKSAFQMLPLSRLHESQTNPRRVFDEAKLLELAASLKAQGLIQPIVARPNADGFEIVAGARRYRAAQLAELSEIPTRVVSLTDEQALEWQLIELSIVGKSFLCLYATWALRLYVIDVASLPQKAGYNGMPPPPRNGMRSLIAASVHL
jgi:ParB family chromosome partitioning protein